MSRLRTLAGMITVALLLFSIEAQAQVSPSDEFYKGKTVTIVVGYGAGGGYDLYARLIAQFLGQHVPGHPAVIVQNMPGAGGLRAARNIFAIAPKDGTVLGMLSQTLPFDSALGYTAGVDAGKFRWLGRAAMNVEVGVASARSGITSIQQAREKVVPSGGTGGTASSTVVPFLLNKLAGTRFKLIAGYKSADEVLLAMERGEVDMVGATGISTILAKHTQQLKNGEIKLIYQSALERHPAAPDTPTIGELGRTTAEKQMLNLFAAGSAIGRSLVAPPSTPDPHVAVLRKAIEKTLNDPALIAFAKTSNVALEPGTGGELEVIVGKVLATPTDVRANAKAVMESMSKK
jgi:tripartite-type tricarboxylate transporter receptor subunit TctC